jgi:hypothetical protein
MKSQLERETRSNKQLHEETNVIREYILNEIDEYLNDKK